MVAQTSEELIGTALNGRWRLVRLLGEGGMGAVFEADGPPGVGKRAIKILHHEYAKEAVILARFLAEFQAGRAINHPNVAQVLETGRSEAGVPYLVMELLEGTPVASYVSQGQALPMAQAVHIAHGVLQALAVAHARGIVHRDIKPDNLFLVNDNAGSFNVKVLDFGIAKVMDAAGGMGQKTRFGVLLGTPGYMSPEQIRDSRGVDARADLWSVGIILYELLTGASPFPADNEFSRLTSVLTEDVKPIGEVVPQLASWTSFFQRALAKEPARRFQSADEMDAALFATLRGRSIRPPAPGGGAPAAAPLPAPAAVPAFEERGSRASFQPADASAIAKNPLQTTAMKAFSDGPSNVFPSPTAAGNKTPGTAVSAAQVPAPSVVHSANSAVAVSTSPATLANAVAPPPPPADGGIRPTLQSAGHQSGVIAAPAQAPSVPVVPAHSLQPTHTSSSHGSVPPPAMPLTASPAPATGHPAPAPVAPTHMSAMSPQSVQGGIDHTPSIDVVDAPPRRGAPYWSLVVVGLLTFVLGLGVGLMIR